MDLDEQNGKTFLEELYRRTQGDVAATVSMYEVGGAIGLNRSEAGSLAESLIVEGLVELKTLAGGIGLTEEGLAGLGYAVAQESAASAEALALSAGPVATEQDRQTMAELVRRIKDGISGLSLAYEALEQIVFDLKTVELHLLSPQPKAPVLRELCRSLHETLAAAGLKDIAGKLTGLLG